MKPEREKRVYFNGMISRQDAIEIMQNKANEQSVRKLLSSRLNIEEDIRRDEQRLNILLDLNQENIRFCLQNDFSAEQLSTFLNIVNDVFRQSLKKKLTPADSYEHIERCFNLHLQQAPPYSLGVFSEAEKLKVFSYTGQLYKFFLMYEISLTKFIDYNIITQEFANTGLREEDLNGGLELSKTVCLLYYPFVQFLLRFRTDAQRCRHSQLYTRLGEVTKGVRTTQR
jgi:hypothetical protein